MSSRPQFHSCAEMNSDNSRSLEKNPKTIAALSDSPTGGAEQGFREGPPSCPGNCEETSRCPVPAPKQVAACHTAKGTSCTHVGHPTS